jgi:hypothetical protein
MDNDKIRLVDLTVDEESTTQILEMCKAFDVPYHDYDYSKLDDFWVRNWKLKEAMKAENGLHYLRWNYQQYDYASLFHWNSKTRMLRVYGNDTIGCPVGFNHHYLSGKCSCCGLEN